MHRIKLGNHSNTYDSAGGRWGLPDTSESEGELEEKVCCAFSYSIYSGTDLTYICKTIGEMSVEV